MTDTIDKTFKWKFNNINVKGVIFKYDELYVAVCLNFGLATQSKTQEKAESKLRNQIIDYIEEIHSEPKYLNNLRNRPAPLSHWFIYYKVKMVELYNKLFGKG